MNCRFKEVSLILLMFQISPFSYSLICMMISLLIIYILSKKLPIIYSFSRLLKMGLK
uniref:ATP synthase F0 subunit 8 n=1 Tax=Trichuris suis TaxID=68888 RepID=A0A0M3ULT9_9BILA|nr:ATP synthase F0 subunit 8 [Trichuris suis]